MVHSCFLTNIWTQQLPAFFIYVGCLWSAPRSLTNIWTLQLPAFFIYVGCLWSAPRSLTNIWSQQLPAFLHTSGFPSTIFHFLTSYQQLRIPILINHESCPMVIVRCRNYNRKCVNTLIIGLDCSFCNVIEQYRPLLAYEDPFYCKNCNVAGELPHKTRFYCRNYNVAKTEAGLFEETPHAALSQLRIHFLINHESCRMVIVRCRNYNRKCVNTLIISLDCSFCNVIEQYRPYTACEDSFYCKNCNVADELPHKTRFYCRNYNVA
ncbi:hypothetical protein FHS16_005809 [Paenibacillus endophyticus]|uniref:Uncharacterized protein n=1 Tax=Paenibacillus endophyticus TaxID=1294268 RepID=A0A7W5CDI4_9BACL|nr:hypothetical protein [Paenibacillus endophyticus]